MIVKTRLHAVRGTRSRAVLAWRIATDAAAYEAEDLTGEGARKTGGRWNEKGVPLVYASSTRALACLETIVHLAVALPLNRYLIEIEIPVSEWNKRTRFAERGFVVGWDATPPGNVSITWGSDWAKSSAALVAEVPSVMVPEEANILLNPSHPAIANVRARKVRRWLYDPRITLPPSRPTHSA